MVCHFHWWAYPAFNGGGCLGMSALAWTLKSRSLFKTTARREGFHFRYHRSTDRRRAQKTIHPVTPGESALGTADVRRCRNHRFSFSIGLARFSFSCRNTCDHRSQPWARDHRAPIIAEELFEAFDKLCDEGAMISVVHQPDPAL
jgi:hypothetical protein